MRSLVLVADNILCPEVVGVLDLVRVQTAVWCLIVGVLFKKTFKPTLK